MSLIGLRGALWRYLDRPLFAGLGPRTGGLAFSATRRFVVSLVLAVLVAVVHAARSAGRHASRQSAIEAWLIMGLAVVVLAPLTHAHWLAEGTDETRLAAVGTRNVELLSMTGDQW